MESLNTISESSLLNTASTDLSANPITSSLSAATAASVQPHLTLLQSKDIIITYNLLLLNLFSTNIQEFQNLGYVNGTNNIDLTDNQDREESAGNVSNSALRILASLFTVTPRSSITHIGFPASTVKTYEKWARSVLESVIWFNSLTGEVAVIVVSNLLTATLTVGSNTTAASLSNDSKKSSSLNKLKYDARLRAVIRQLTSLLMVGSERKGEAAATTLDSWDLEKTRSFMQQRIEQTVVTYMVSEKRRHPRNTTSTLKNNVPQTVRNISTSETSSGSAAGTHPGLQVRRSTINGSFSKPTPKKAHSLKVETTKREEKNEEDVNVMKWMYSGITTPLVSMGSMLTSLNNLTSTSPSNPSLMPSVKTMFGVADENDPLLSIKNDCGLEDWFTKEVLIHDSALHVVLCVSGLLNSIEDVVDPWHFLPAYAPFSDIPSSSQSNKRRKSDTSSLQITEQHPSPTAVNYFAIYRRKEIQPLELALHHPSSRSIGSGYPISPTANTVSMFPTPPGLLETWSYALSAAQLAGEQLGKRILLREAFGKRPITLTGFGLVVKSAELGDSNAFSLIDSVYLITAPVVLELEAWTKISAVVSGRLVNAYSSKDTVLSLFQSYVATPVQYIGSNPISAKPSLPLSTSTILNYTTVNHSDVFTNKVENQFCHNIMERIGFERCVFEERSMSPIPNDESDPGFTAPIRGRQLSKLIIPIPQLQKESPQVESVTIFDANEIFTASSASSAAASSLDEGTPELLTAIGAAEFLITPTSAQISRDIIYEPSCTDSDTIIPPGSNRTLDEDEA
ncbi:hypothetical protein BDR26DRAFT_869643 [Obelidium mucronatum]|nr:hypothetical protein BDR26DRAFT_869643 [Obelidium mucronatum]